VKQVTQRLRDGRIELIDVPPPAVTPDGVLVDVRASVLSPGTEGSKVKTGRQSLLGKARSRPDDVRRVIEKAQRDGLRETVQAVRSRLDEPSPMGYSAAGVVLEVGDRVRDLVPGDRVACAGADYAVHAEIDHVPSNLCVPLPPSVPFEVGAFATLASVALHGTRQADVRLGERVAVIGLGLVGQLTGQLLRAAGCRSLGVDLSPELVALSEKTGAADAAFTRDALSGERLPDLVGSCDAVIITAATPSADPVELAAQLCRDRGRVVVVGDVGMDLPRPPYYGKELELRLSRSYGPGRYDRDYEERGLDYPIGYVRWTERRNMVAFVELVAAGKLDVGSLVTERIPLERAPEAYERILSGRGSPLGIVLQYPRADSVEASSGEPTPVVQARQKHDKPPLENVGVIGAGGFAKSTVIPSLERAGFHLAAVASATGRSAHAAQQQFGFERVETPEAVIAHPGVGLVAVVTRHATHAPLAASALEAGKAVFVEKPPCLTWDELEHLRSVTAASTLPLVVGFNRRHAPLARSMRDHLRESAAPFELVYRVNAGPLPGDHWLNDPDDGGGRLLGEGCHFLDFACWFAGDVPARVSCFMRAEPETPIAAAQTFVAVMDFADGSVATILYGSQGAQGVAKEYVEAHAGGRSAVLDDFRSLALHDGSRRARRVRSRGRDKGHAAQFAHLRSLLSDGCEQSTPSPLDSMAATFAALRSAETGRAVSL
jgi:predicted dehydrogenase/threonine dehydrogenase-like Zn-dependent dehydrogenase